MNGLYRRGEGGWGGNIEVVQVTKEWNGKLSGNPGFWNNFYTKGCTRR